MLNRVALVGRLAADVELKHTQSGMSVASFRLAVQRNRKNQQGTYESDFIDIVAWQHSADFCAKYCRKGGMVAVDGRIQTRTYDAKDGTKRHVVEVIADDITLCEKKQNAENGVTTEQNAAANRGEFTEVPSDDELPF